MPADKNFTFICGADAFLVGRLGQAGFDALAAGVADEFSREVLSGFAGNVGEVETALNRFRESVQTVSMFGGRRVIWLKDVNFLADTVTGRAESTLKLVEDLQQLLDAVNPDETAVLVTAAPVDRRRAFPKWCEKNGDFALAGGDGDNAAEALAGVALAEAKSLGAAFAPGAVELMLAKVGANTRLIVEETRKLATHAGEGARIEEADVAELTPNVAEGDFFEAAEAFFSGDLKWTLAALHRQGNQLLPGGKDAFEGRIASLRGYPAMVNVWASWCGGCRFEFPTLQRLSAAFGKRVAFLGVNTLDSDDAAATFLEEAPVPYPSYTDHDRDIAESIGAVRGYPDTAFYKRDGELCISPIADDPIEAVRVSIVQKRGG